MPEATPSPLLELGPKLEKALLNEPISITIQDGDLRYIWVHNLHKAWGSQDLLGKLENELEPADTEFQSKLQEIKEKALATGKRQLLEDWMGFPNGDRFFFRVTADPYEMPDGTMGLITKAYDITDQKHIEGQLESLNADLKKKVSTLETVEKELSLALEGEPIILFIADHELRYVWAYNLPKGLNVIGKTDLEVHPDPIAGRMTMAAKRRAIETGERQVSEGWTTDKLGNVVYRRSIYDPYPMPNGTIGVIGKHYNLTEHKEIEKELENKVIALETLERELALALEGEPIILFTTDQELRYTWAYNLPKGINVIGKTDLEVNPDPEAARDIMLAKRKAIRLNKRHVTEGWTTDKLGRRVYRRSIYDPYPLPNGKIGIIGKHYDLTEAKEAEKSLEERVAAFETLERELTLALEGEPIILFIADHELRYTWAYNLPKGLNVIGKTDLEVHPDPEAARLTMEAKRKTIETGKRQVAEGWTTDKLGRRVYRKSIYDPYMLQDGSLGVIGKHYDLSEQKKVEEALEEKVKALETLERELGLALEGEPIILFIADSQLRYTWAYNLPKGLNVIGKTDLEVHPDPEAARQTMEAKRKTIETGQRQVFEGWTTDKLGQVVYRRSIYDPHKLADGSAGVIGKHYNLTREKQVEQELEAAISELRDSEQKLRVAVTDPALAIFLQDQDLRYTWMVMDRQGWNPANMIGKTDLEIYTTTPEDAQLRHNLKKQVLETGKPVEHSGWLKNPDGPGRKFITGRYTPFTYPDGRKGVMGRFTDITELRLAQEKVEDLNRTLNEKLHQLELSEAKLNTAISDESLILFLQDENIRFQWVSVHKAGWDAATMIGKTDLEVFPVKEEAERRYNLKKRLIETGEAIEFSGWINNPLNDGRVFWQGRYVPYNFPDGRKGLMGRFVDITALRLTQEKVEELNRELESKIGALEEAERRFEIALEGEPISLYIQNKDLRYLWVHNLHPAWKGLDLVGKTDREIGFISGEKDDLANKNKLEVLRTGERKEQEAWYDMPDGQSLYLKTIFEPYPLPGGNKGLVGKTYDLTSIKQTEREVVKLNETLSQKVQELEDTQGKLTAALAGEPITLAILDEKLNYIWVHNTSPKLNYSEENQSKGVAGQVVEEDARFLDALRRRVLKSGQQETVSMWIHTVGGERAFMKMAYAPYRLPNGKTGLIGKAFDLTDFQLTKETVDVLNQELRDKVVALEESEAKLRTALDTEALAIYIQDEEGRYVWMNISQEAWQGETWIGKTDMDIFPEPVVGRSLFEAKKRVVDTGKPFEWSGWIINPFGGRQYVRALFSPYTFPDGSKGTVNRAIDLTQMMEAQEQIEHLNQELEGKVFDLEDADNKLRMALEGEPIILFLQDKDLRYVWSYNIQGFDLIGKTDLELHPSRSVAEETMAAKRKAIDTRSKTILEGWSINGHGQRVFRKSIYHPYTFPDGTVGVLGKYYDLTDVKQAEEELKVLNQALNKEKREVDAALKRLSEEHQRKLNDLAEASRLQHALLPKGLPLEGKLDFAAHMATCLEVGGDYYDFKERDGRALFAVGDATGHGLQSGTIVAMVKSYFQLLALNQPVETLMDTISSSLSELDLRKMFMGLLLLEYQPDGFVYSSAGMPPVWVFRAKTGTVESYLQKRVFLGTGLATRTTPIHIPMAAGDILVALTDGIIESTDSFGKMVPVEEIEGVLKAKATKGPKAIVEGLFALQRAWMENRPLKDDSTVIAIRYK